MSRLPFDIVMSLETISFSLDLLLYILIPPFTLPAFPSSSSFHSPSTHPQPSSFLYPSHYSTFLIFSPSFLISSPYLPSPPPIFLLLLSHTSCSFLDSVDSLVYQHRCKQKRQYPSVYFWRNSTAWPGLSPWQFVVSDELYSSWCIGLNDIYCIWFIKPVTLP